MPISVITAPAEDGIQQSAASVPGGGVICVNNCSDMPESPFFSSVHRIAPRNIKPTLVAPTRQRKGCDVGEFAPEAAFHTEPSALRSIRCSISRAALMTTKVMRNSSTLRLSVRRYTDRPPPR